MTKMQAAKILRIIEGAFPGRFQSNDAAIDVWAGSLSDIPYELASQAAAALCRTNVHPPTIAEIRRAVVEAVNPLPNVEEAYEAAREAARTYSPYAWHPYQQVDPTARLHPLVKQALDTIGIETMAYTDEPSVVAAQFRRVYENLRERQIMRRQQGDVALVGAPASARLIGEGGAHLDHA